MIRTVLVDVFLFLIVVACISTIITVVFFRREVSRDGNNHTSDSRSNHPKRDSHTATRKKRSH